MTSLSPQPHINQEGVAVKKILAGLAAATLTLAAAGCGSDDASASSADIGAIADLTSHDELVAMAEEEGQLKVSTSFTEEAIVKVEEEFEAAYPGIDLDISEQSGDDDKRILLEMQAESSDIDVLHLSAESYHEYLPYVADIDLMQLVEDGVLDMPAEMINPKEPGTMAAGSGLGAFSYNPELLSPDLVPTSWDDFLRPELKGRKFLVDIEPANLAILGVAWGEEKLLDFASKIKDQDPIWVRGDTNSITLMTAGEFELHAFSNYHSAFRVSLETDNIEIGLLEPVPVRLTHIQAVSKNAAHPAAATLFIEFTTGLAVQQALDEDEPRQSSIYAGDSSLHELIEGKETSVLGWEDFDNQPKWESAIVEKWGFPTAEVEEE